MSRMTCRELPASAANGRKSQISETLCLQARLLDAFEDHAAGEADDGEDHEAGSKDRRWKAGYQARAEELDDDWYAERNRRQRQQGADQAEEGEGPLVFEKREDRRQDAKTVAVSMELACGISWPGLVRRGDFGRR